MEILTSVRASYQIGLSGVRAHVRRLDSGRLSIRNRSQSSSLLQKVASCEFILPFLLQEFI